MIKLNKNSSSFTAGQFPHCRKAAGQGKRRREPTFQSLCQAWGRRLLADQGMACVQRGLWAYPEGAPLSRTGEVPHRLHAWIDRRGSSSCLSSLLPEGVCACRRGSPGEAVGESTHGRGQHNLSPSASPPVRVYGTCTRTRHVSHAEGTGIWAGSACRDSSRGQGWPGALLTCGSWLAAVLPTASNLQAWVSLVFFTRSGKFQMAFPTPCALM